MRDEGLKSSRSSLRLGLRSSLPLILCLWFCLCAQAEEPVWVNEHLTLGDEKEELYVPLMEGLRVAIFSNQTGCQKSGEHILDVLLRHGVEVTTLFSPEHGFRGNADAGERVKSSVDEKTGIPILSLYDQGKQGPSDEAMGRFDMLVVDIQDVGLRFYTYYVSMLNLMKRCSECDKQVLIMDRPNPNGHYVDGPILDMSLKSGVGALPIPIVHGMTLGELAFMAMGEGWAPHCKLKVIPCSGYSHDSLYCLPIAPSPNLPDMRSIYLYPSMCYFEGTPVSLGRGTSTPFQVFGHPDFEGYDFSFTPESRPGAKNPPQLGKKCWGRDLSQMDMRGLQQLKRIDLSYIVEAYQHAPKKDEFFTRFFDLLTGQRRIRQMIEEGATAQEIEASWRNEVEEFLQTRAKYLLY